MQWWGKRSIRLGLAVAFILSLPLIGKYANPFADDVPAQQSWTSAVRPPPMSETYIPPPVGFPRIEYPPSKISVPPGSPQPIATQYGLTYTIPANWVNWSTSTAGWEAAGQRMLYGGVGEYGLGYCPASPDETLALSGAAGRNGASLDAAARAEIHKAEKVFGDGAKQRPQIDVTGPFPLEVSGKPSVRYIARLHNVSDGGTCDPNTVLLDVIATPGYATAEVMLLVVQRDAGFKDSISDSDVDNIVKSLRRS